MEKRRFSGRIWPDWGNTARADMAGLGSIGLSDVFQKVARDLLCLLSHIQDITPSPSMNSWSRIMEAHSTEIMFLSL